MTLTGDFELVSYNFYTGELMLRRKVYDQDGVYEDTLSLVTRVPEFKGLSFEQGKQFRVTIEEM